jgi:putative nucleotidyltransferase with HDIG domain
MLDSDIKYILVNPKAQKEMDAIWDKAELPTLPTVYMNLQKIINSEDANASAVAKVIENDQSLALKVLRTVNSAAFGLRHSVDSIERAVALLGFDEVSNIVLAASVVRSFDNLAGRGIFSIEKFWDHSMAVAVAARVLAENTPRITREIKQSVFMGGLVHDIGKLVEYQLFNESFVNVLHTCRQDKLTIHQSEKKVMGFSHQDSGAYLLDKWNMPRNMVKAVELHHDPDDLWIEDDSYMFVAIIHIADVLGHFLEIGSGGDPFIPVISENAWENLGIDIGQVPEILETIKLGYQEVRKVMQG